MADGKSKPVMYLPGITQLRATSWRESSLFPDQFSQTKNGLGTRLEGEGVAHFRSGPCSVGIESLQSESSACFLVWKGNCPRRNLTQ